MKKYTFICCDSECIKQGQYPCFMTFWGEENPDYPSYCPYETDPAEHKYKPWKKVID